MNQAKFEAARRLNDLENSLNVINESIMQIETTLAHAKAIQSRTSQRIADARLAVDAMPDDKP